MSALTYPEKQVCITGAGQSKVGRPSKSTALELTLEACEQAIADAQAAGAKVSIDDFIFPDWDPTKDYISK